MDLLEGKEVEQVKLSKDQRRSLKFLLQGKVSEEQVYSKLREFLQEDKNYFRTKFK